MLTLYSTRALDRLFNDVWNNAWETYTPSYANNIKVNIVTGKQIGRAHV